MVEGLEVAGEEVLFCPVELGDEFRVFLIESRVGDGSPIRIDPYGYPLMIEPVDGMVREGGVDVGLEIAGGADLEMDMALPELSHQCCVFGATDAVADTGRMEVGEGFPDAFGSLGLSGVGRTGDAVVMGILKGGDMVGDGIAGFIGGDVEADDMRGPTGDLFIVEFFGEFCGLQALFFCVVAEGAEDEAGLDTGFLDTLGYGAVDDGDYLFGVETFLAMLERCETELSVDDMVLLQLVEEIEGGQA